MSGINWLQKWYLSQCDGDWEHQFGVQIGTLDNPGWRIIVDLDGTELEGVVFQSVEFERSEADWVHTRVEKEKFLAACGPENLEDAIAIFKSWAETVAGFEGDR